MNKPTRYSGAIVLDSNSLTDRWREFWRRPDSLLLDEGGTGERAVAYLRLVVTGVLSLLALVLIVQAPQSSISWAAMAAAAVALLFAVAVHLVAKQNLYGPWIGFATSVLDVTFVSATFIVFLLIGEPHLVVNSRVLFSLYFITIAATALRYDPRICAVSGLLGVLQYAAIVAYADARWVLNDPTYAPFESGMFDLNAHYGRLILMLFAVALSTTIVLRAQHLRWLSAKDPLTGLMNRGFFDERMQAEVVRNKRYGRNLALAMIDIDHFKLFNDTYGHAVGDDVLRTVANTIEQSVRKSDLVSRYGGEEFVVVFPETSVGSAVDKTDELRKAIQTATVHLPQVPATSGVTVSAGIASMPADTNDMRDALDRADQRLYEAKQAGRNRVVGPPDFTQASA